MNNVNRLWYCLLAQFLNPIVRHLSGVIEHIYYYLQSNLCDQLWPDFKIVYREAFTVL